MISVVIPIFNEIEVLPELHRRLTATLTATNINYEIIYVDDGSSDESLPYLISLYNGDRDHIRVISFSRNFGHQTAISAGLHYSTGDAVIVMDGDLQDPPEVLPRFIEMWKEGYEVVYGVRTQRK